MSFANPWFLALALPLVFVAWRLLRRGRKSGIRFSALSRIPRRSAGWRALLASLTPFVLLSGLALLVIAVARPRTPLAHEKKSVDAIAIAMTVDVSGSMDALDLTPKGQKFSRETTRLAVVKKLFAEFVDKRPDDLIGLITFGGYASTRSPLTADHAALLNVLKGVEIPSVAVDDNGRAIAQDEQMTAVGDGLATALARLKDAKPTSKIVILLSDGVSNTGAVEPADAAEAAAKLGIKVYAIGVGTKARRTPIFQRDFFGREVVQYADMTFDEKQLKEIAMKTKGTYFPVNDRDSLEKALEEIDKLETTKLEADAYDRWAEHFTFFLVSGAFLVLAAVTLSMAAVRRLACIAAALSLVFLAGCFTVSESEYPTSPMSPIPTSATNCTLVVRGFEATVTEYMRVYNYDTVYVPGYFGRRHYHPGGFQTVMRTTDIPQIKPTDVFFEQAKERFEAAGFNLNVNPADYIVEVKFSGPLRSEDSEDAKRVLLWLCTVFTADMDSDTWSAKLKIYDNHTGRLVFSQDYAQEYNVAMWSPIPLLGPLSYDKTDYGYAQSWCLTALTERVTADASAFLANLNR